MRCKSCDYPLWQIKGRQCPECGRAFAPSEFEFVLNSVRFCCPHCEQDYYGTGAKGHLEPRTFACVKCERTIDMDEMVLLPTEGVEEAQTETDSNPWIRPRKGMVGAWFATVGRALVAPARLIRCTPPDASTGRAMAFAGVTMLVVAVVSTIPPILMSGLMMGVGTMAGGGGRGGGAGMPAGMGNMMLAQVGVTFGWTIAWVVGWILALTAVAHGLLRITGRCEHGIGRTFQTMCYSSGANVVSAAPCVGMFGAVWWVVSAVVMLREGQKVSGGRAALAVLTLPVIGLIAGVGFVIWAIVGITGGGPGLVMSSTVTMNAGSQASDVTTALVDRLTDASQPPLVHASELLVDSEIMETDLIDPLQMGGGGWAVRMAQVKVGGRTLDQWQYDTRSAKTGAAARAAAVIQGDSVAYRMGDMVFTHPGMNPVDPKWGSSKLWVLVMWPDGMPTPTGLIHAGCADGTVHAFAPGDMAAELAAQNQLRATFGLAPLPPPVTVPQGQAVGPATGGGEPSGSGDGSGTP